MQQFAIKYGHAAILVYLILSKQINRDINYNLTRYGTPELIDEIHKFTNMSTFNDLSETEFFHWYKKYTDLEDTTLTKIMYDNFSCIDIVNRKIFYANDPIGSHGGKSFVSLDDSNIFS